ncbi:MAG: prealbumin-like fold domain-containing protein [Dermatophilaceae bacterium]
MTRSVSVRTRGLRVRGRAIAAALALVFLATTLGGVPQDAQGYTPGSFSPASGSDPTIVVDVFHTPTSPQPKQGETYTYKATFTLGNMAEPNTTNEVVITVNADPNAPWTAVPVPGDFASSYGAPTLSNCTVTACTATWANIKTNGTITFTKTAKVSSLLGEGEVIIGSASAKINTVPLVKLTNVSSTAFPGQCSGTYTFNQKVDASGAWLADMKFADVSGEGKVILTPDGATQIRAWNDPLAEGDTIKVISGADGTDITAAVMANATYRSTDPSSPFYIGLSPSDQTYFANADWLDSLNWSYDPDSWTGNTWLPAGTTIEVKREVTYLGCLPGGITGDGTSNREFGISTEIARANTTASGSDVDVFSTPGQKPPASCVNNLYVSGNSGTGSTTTTFAKWSPATSTTTSLSPVAPFRTDAIAASANYPAYIFAVDYNAATGSTTGFRVYDSGGGLVAGQGTSTWPGGSSTAAAFDPAGNLIVITTGGNVRYLTAAQVTSYLAGGAVTWNTGPILSGSDGSAVGRILAYDLAFDGDGNAWLAGRNSLYKFAASTLLGGANVAVTLTTRYALSSPSLIRGLAFVGSKLYMGGGGTATTQTLYEISWTATTPTVTAVTGVGFNVPTESDFASCSYPSKTAPPSGPAFQVQKSVVNPDGSIAPEGLAGATRTLNADGSMTIDYVITVTNVGTAVGAHPAMPEKLTIPTGFQFVGVKLNGTAQTDTDAVATTFSFTIPASTVSLDPFGNAGPIFTSYVVSMTVKAPDFTAVNWTQAGTCGAMADNVYAGGFFNLVSLTNDMDGVSNNDACAPVSSARLNLVKQIVDQSGTLVPGTVTWANDSQYFDLTAAGTTGFIDKSMTNGEVGAKTYVVPGTYRLGEQGNDGGATSGQYDLYATWSCINLASGNAVVPVAANGTISVPNGSDIQCTIKNTKKPKVHIAKTATTPIAGNTHIGQTITPAPDGTFTTSYTITVTNTSGFTTTTGPITDGFLVPAGLLWDGTKTATVTYNAGTTGATATGLVSSVTQAQLATWATLATSVANLPNNGSVSFTITIPLKLDLTVPAGSTQTVYETNATKLSSCESLTSSTGGTYTSFASGIPNMTSIRNEDLTYSTIAVQDNTACVPVVANLQWAVSKAAASTTAADGTVSAWAPAGTTGGTVQVAADGTVTVNYKVVVTNTGDITLKHPAITDTLTLPTGFGLTSVTVKQGTTTVYSGTTASFTIPASTTTVAPGGTVEYIVQITATVTSPSTVDWVKAGTCNTTGNGVPGDGGFFNFVSLTSDTDGSANNDACVPVTPPSTTITVYKLGANCDTDLATCPLPGASFALYAVNPTTAGATPTAMTPDSSGAVFTSAPLSYGATYWLVETKAPSGFSMLAAPVQFTVSTTGITLADPTTNTGVVAVATDDAFALTVLDTPVADLPKAGGLGFVPYLVFGMFLVAFGAAYHTKTSGRLALGYAQARRPGAGRHRAGGRDVRQHHHTNP